MQPILRQDRPLSTCSHSASRDQRHCCGMECLCACSGAAQTHSHNNGCAATRFRAAAASAVQKLYNSMFDRFGTRRLVTASEPRLPRSGLLLAFLLGRTSWPARPCAMPVTSLPHILGLPCPDRDNQGQGRQCTTPESEPARMEELAEQHTQHVSGPSAMKTPHSLPAQARTPSGRRQHAAHHLWGGPTGQTPADPSGQRTPLPGCKRLMRLSWDGA